MIYTITLNPALDHYLEVDALTVEEANRVRSECLYAGGKGIDVSRAVRHLGGDSIALGFIGGHNGAVMLELLKREGVNCYCTPISDETRRNVIISTRGPCGQTLLHSAGPRVTREEWRNFLTHLDRLDLRDAYVVLGGSLPRGIAVGAYAEIIRLVQRRGARAILDADGPCLRLGIQAKPFAIKPNVHELQRLTRRALPDEAHLLHAARRLHQQGIEIVIVSRGPAGLLVSSPDGSYRATPPRVTVKSTIGAGDSTVAGFVFCHAGGKALEDCLRVATAAGTAATLRPGNQLCRLRDVQRLAPRVAITRLA
ncbi:1-phosphofructokinase [Candidatus Nitrospira bockiana]